MFKDLFKNFKFGLILIFGILSHFKIAKCIVCPNQESKVQTNEPCFDIISYDYVLNKKVIQDKRIELECYVKNKGQYSVVWLYNNQIISVNDLVVKPIVNVKIDTDAKRKYNLIISNVDASQNGSYVCQITTPGVNNLDYVLEVMVPPKITRIPKENVIVLKEGDSATLQCLTSGNPKPKLAWTKKGEKGEHTTIDDSKSIMSLQNVDESHSETYTCTARNGIGNPVSSEFQILVKYKPKIVLSEQENVNQSVMYTTVNRKEIIVCRVNAYPKPKMSLFLNDDLISTDSYTFEENKNIPRQYVLTYNFVSSLDTFGTYKCLAENEMGSNETSLKVTGSPSVVSINIDKLPLYSDAVLFEWSLYSGSAIHEINVQYFSSNNTNGTNVITKTKQFLPDGTESQPTYHNDYILYKDFYDIPKLQANTTYIVRMRAKNEMNEWSEWSQNLTVRTHADENEKINKHKASFQMHHHRHHDKKHKSNYQSGSRDLNSKRDRYNSYLSEENSAFTLRSSFSSLAAINLVLSVLIAKFYL